MSKPWNTHFELDPQDIELIEAALRQKCASLAANDNCGDSHVEAKALRELLGKIHNQKVWYNPNKGAGVAVPLG